MGDSGKMTAERESVGTPSPHANSVYVTRSEMEAQQ